MLSSWHACFSTHYCASIFLHAHAPVLFSFGIFPQPKSNTTIVLFWHNNINSTESSSRNNCHMTKLANETPKTSSFDSELNLITSQVLHLQRQFWTWRLGDTCEKTSEHDSSLASTTRHSSSNILISATRSKNTLGSSARPRKRTSPIPTCYGLLPPSLWFATSTKEIRLEIIMGS